MTSFGQLIQQIKRADYAGANQTFADIMQQKVADRLAIERQTIFKEADDSLNAAETKKKEEIVKSMKKDMSDFEDRYGERAKEVMYATATKMAKENKKAIEESLMGAATINKRAGGSVNGEQMGVLLRAKRNKNVAGSIDLYAAKRPTECAICRGHKDKKQVICSDCYDAYTKTWAKPWE